MTLFPCTSLGKNHALRAANFHMSESTVELAAAKKLRNSKRFVCFHKVTVTRVEVWKNEKSSESQFSMFP